MTRKEQRPTHSVGRPFFARHHLTVARELIGCELFWDGVSGRIVETEAYAVDGDEACHTAFRPSARRFFAAHKPGTAYVYLNYGIHWMLNVLALDGIILIRALEPTGGLDLMRTRRGPKVNDHLLCSGPGRLGQALSLCKLDHGTSLMHRHRYIQAAVPDHEAVSDKRVGLTRATENLWRFLLPAHPCVSVPHGKVKPGKTARA